MANWLAKILPPPQKSGRRNLPMNVKPGGSLIPEAAMPPGGLPNASVIYGAAASVLFVIAIYFLFTGLWFTGLLVLLPAGGLLGFALHFLKHAG